MPRLRRWLFNGIVLASAIIFLLTVALWIRSVSYGDSLWLANKHAIGCGVETKPHGVIMEVMQTLPWIGASPLSHRSARWGAHVGTTSDGISLIEDWTPLAHQWIGFGWEYSELYLEPNGFNLWSVNVEVPFWFILLLLSIFPWHFIRSRRLQRNRVCNNLCVSCGYDLRTRQINARNAERIGASSQPEITFRMTRRRNRRDVYGD